MLRDYSAADQGQAEGSDFVFDFTNQENDTIAQKGNYLLVKGEEIWRDD